MKERQADSPCAISVAQAAPAMPMSRTATMKRSRATFSRDEKTRKYSGMRERPSALKVDERMLYMNRNGRPRKYILR